jgi:chromatin segregation and condensation protein Rec8/ScpA/Scc1 (kleisin family)
MAILELVKMQEISFRQEERFGQILVSRRQRPREAGPAAEEPSVPAETPAHDAPADDRHGERS